MNDLNPRIETLKKKLLAGHFMQMSLSVNRTFDLWQGFQQRRKEITDVIGSDLYSMQIFDPQLNFQQFNPTTMFTKWAAIEVSTHEHLPKGLNSYILTGGLYAVFQYKGTPQEFGTFMQAIMGQWLPSSEYLIDNREHFEVLSDKYIHNSVDSEEEVWIPIKLKTGS